MPAIDETQRYRAPDEDSLGRAEGHISDTELNTRLAQYGTALRPSPGEVQWPAGWLPGDDPVEIALDPDTFPPHGGGTEGGVCAGSGQMLDPQPGSPTPNPLPHGRGLCTPLHPATVFDTRARVRFLDALAGHGNVRAASALIGVSRETVYRARRRYADFARCWDMALVHARARYEAELATRAVDGVAVPIFVRGEHVATWRRHDARYLLAHLARLDRRIADKPDTVQSAEHFDHLLAAIAGHAPPEDFAEAVEAMRERRDDCGQDTPPTQEEYIMHARCEAVFDAPVEDNPQNCASRDQAEAEAMHASAKTASQAWDEWNAAGLQLIDRMLADEPSEYSPSKNEAGDSVTCVNTPIKHPIQTPA